MTLRQRALLDVMKVLTVGMIVGAVITVAVEYLGLALVAPVILLVALIYLAKTAYDIRVAQLTSEAERVQRALRDGR